MAYTYYTPVEAEEHYPYASEMASVLFDAFGLASRTGKPATRFVKALLEDLREYRGEPALYYPAGRGLSQVYRSYREVYDVIHGAHEQAVEDGMIGKEITRPVGGTSYTFRFGK